MFDEFVSQIKKLFSSKCNGGKLIYNLTDKLHYYKQILLALSIVLLLGYSQFRDHFLCQGTDRVDRKIVTNLCWINGTTTLNRIDGNTISGSSNQRPAARYSLLVNNSNVDLPKGSSILDQIVPHVGIHFRLNEGKYELVSHNYMRSLWALLILMAICSYVAQRKWSTIFSDDLLKALLKLPGNEELPIVKKAQDLNSYEFLTKLPAVSSSSPSAEHDDHPFNQDHHHQHNQQRSSPATSKQQQQQQQQQLGLRDIFGDQGQVFVDRIEILVGEGNGHNHDLDYYPNQLIYLLLTRQRYAYKLPGLKLRQKLLCHSFWSLLLTVMQFALPWFFIGPKYTLYGWHFARLALRHIMEQFEAYPRTTLVNSLDYELTSSIFPTSTQCEYKQYSFQGIERAIVQCTVPINEICGKLFVVIWWFVIVNIVIELWSFVRNLICSINFSTVQWTFGRLYWPQTQQEAKLINNFRYRHADLLARIEAETAERRLLELEAAEQLHRQHEQDADTLGGGGAGDVQDEHLLHDQAQISRINNGHRRQHRQQPASRQVLSERERKQLEAAEEDERSDRMNRSIDSNHPGKKLYLWCSRDVGLFLAGKGKQKFGSRAHYKPTSGMDMMDGKMIFGGGGGRHIRDINFRASKHDVDLYYLLYLIYLRLNCSGKEMEQVIHMTSEALARYLDRLEQSEWSVLSLSTPSSASSDQRSGPMSSSTTSTTIVPSSVSATEATAAAAAASHHNQQQ